MSRNLRASSCAVLAALLWGSAFIAQDLGTDTVGSFTFCATRSWIGAAILLLISFLFRKHFTVPIEARPRYKHDLVWGGLACGIAMSIASNLQQAGIAAGTSSGKAGFITSLYVVLVPVFGLFCKRRAPWIAWIGTAIAVVGLYLLCIDEALRIQAGDIFVLLCAVFFALQILFIDRLPHIHGIHLCCAQLIVVAVTSTVLSLIFEPSSLPAIGSAIGPILYCGVFSSAFAYTLQILAQKGSNPTVITLLLSLESVFAVLCTALFVIVFPSSPLDGDLATREWIGCGLMFVAVTLANLPVQPFGKKK